MVIAVEESGSANAAGASGRATFAAGVRNAFPIAIGYFPIAFSFGVAATRAGFTVVEAIFVSVSIYAGASQFMALLLLTGGTPLTLTIGTLLAMNLRHVLYGPALLDRAGARPSTQHAWLWGFGLTDEVFATAVGLLSRGERSWSERWMLGLATAAYASWIAGTAAGALAGAGALSAFPAVEAGLGFMLPALFLALLLAILERRQLPVVSVSGLVCAGATTLANSLSVGILAGMVAGALYGTFRPARETRRE